MAGPLEPRSSDWPAQAADRVESVVGAIRDRTTKPLTTAARALVYGLVVGVMGIAIVVLLAIALVRLLDVYLPDRYLPDGVWFAYLIIGMLFTLFGLFLWSKRHKKG